MLRYDSGHIVKIISDEPINNMYAHKFKALIESNNYTPDRYKSFGIKTELLSKERVKASEKVKADFEDTYSVSKFLREEDKS